MKKLIFVLLVLCLSFGLPPALHADVTVVVGGGVPVVGDDYTDCSMIGSYDFMVTFDHAADNKDGCSDTSTTVNGTLGAGAEIVAGSTSPGTASGMSAGNVLKLDSATNENIKWPISGIADINEGTLDVDVYVAASTGYTNVNIFYVNSNNFTTLRFSSDGTIRFDHYGNSTRMYVDTTAKMPDTTWTTIKLRWSYSNNKMAIKVGGNAWQEATGTFAEATDPTNIELTMMHDVDDIYFDNLFVKTTYEE